MEGCDAVIHAAAIYEVGIPASERQAMREANVGGTERVLGAALEAKVPQGRLRLHRRHLRQHPRQDRRRELRAPGQDFTSYYEETKWEAHQVAKRLIGEGLPCVIVQPGGVYGPGDTSSIGVTARPVPRREDAADPLPRARHLPDPRRGHRRRHPPGARQGHAPARPTSSAARSTTMREAIERRRRGQPARRRRSAPCRPR